MVSSRRRLADIADARLSKQSVHPHPVMLRLEPMVGGGFMETPLPKGTPHAYGQLLSESVQALRSRPLRESGFASLAPRAPRA